MYSCVLLSVLLGACSSNKYLDEGEYFLEENEVRIKSEVRVRNKSVLRTALEERYQQPATRTFFGIPRHWFYYRTIDNPDSTWLKSWVQRKIADPPVILDTTLSDQTVVAMQRYLREKGYWSARVSYQTKFDRKRATVIYHADPWRRWRVESIRYISPDTTIQRILDTIVTESHLAPGAPVDIELYNQERRRIIRALQNRGYANFTGEYVSRPLSDSSNLKMKLEIEIFNPPEGRHQAYTIGEITVYPDYSEPGPTTIDTVIEGVRFITAGERILVKPDIILRNIYLQRGKLYNRDDFDKSYRQLSKLDTYKFVSIKASHSAQDSTVLDYTIILTRNKKMGIGGDLELNYASLSGGQRSLMGLGANVNYRNRNLFRGAELFLTNLETGVEINLRDADNRFNSLNFSLQNNLLVPKFIDPLNFYSRLNKTRIGKNGLLGDNVFRWIREGNSRINLSYQFLSLFDLYSYHTLSASLGYDAQPDAQRRFELNHIGLNYFSPTTQPAFDTILSRNRFLRESFGKQLFTGLFFRDYRYIFNSQISPGGNSYSIIHSAELSGLEILGINSLYNALSGRTGKFSIGSDTASAIDFAHYAKFEFDSRFYRQLTSTKQLAFRLSAGVAFPYGPFTRQVPFVKQFYLGGPLSIRAWQIRELGPGGYEDTSFNADTSVVFYQTGDVKLELSGEYRFKIGWILEGALFVDAGNVWTLQKDPERPGANFSGDFLKQIAIGTGFGLRMDFNYFLIRLDLGLKVRNPFPDEEGRYWLFHEIKDFSFDLINTNFAIGYPF